MRRGIIRARARRFASAWPNAHCSSLCVCSECSGFDCDWSVFPSASAQLWFLRNYLSTRRVVALGDVSMREAHALYAETQCWLLAPHLFWAAWAVVQARHSPIEFDYLAYAKQRWEGYLTMKDRAHEWIKKTTEEVDAMETIR